MNPTPTLPVSTQAPRYARITGTGSHLPPRRLSNADMTAMLAQRGLETSDEWIVERTGIRARHFADDGVNSSDLALHAARAALQAAGRAAEDVDLIIVATSTPDMVFPSTACILQHKLGVSGCPAFDLQAVCSGFVYALSVADAMVRSGGASCALVVGAEVFSRILDFNDRATCVLFGDGAGAVVLEASDAQLTGRTKSYVAMEALGEYLAWRVPQIEDLAAAVAAADSGAFAQPQEVEAVLSGFGEAPRPKAAARRGRAARRT